MLEMRRPGEIDWQASDSIAHRSSRSSGANSLTSGVKFD